MPEEVQPERLIELERVLAGALPGPLAGLAARVLEVPLGIRGVNAIHAAASAGIRPGEDAGDFFLRTLQVMDVSFSVDAAEFASIPAEGPLIVVSNHPFGGVDGVVLGAILLGARADAKLMGNYLLSRIKGIREAVIAVNPFEGPDSARANLGGIRQALRTLQQGGCIGVFPAGEVSCLRLRQRAVTDRPWTAQVVSLALRTGACILPVFIEGRNSHFFQLAGLLHPRVRTLLLAREFARMRGARLTVRVSDLVTPDRLERFQNVEAAAEYLRLRSYALRRAGAPKADRRTLSFPFGRPRPQKNREAVAPPGDRAGLRAEIARLDESALLARHQNFRVCLARADQIPQLLLEIGRMREETFRAVGEGTGSARDTDAFDAYYRHLFMWDDEAGKLVGAYRIGLTDEILEERGGRGLYTSTLFRFKPGFLQRLGPAMELGRSFVALEYQKKHASLALIWRGIGEFIVRHPRYKTLFGPVSITDEYNSISKHLMVHFLREHKLDPELARFVRARKPPAPRRSVGGVSLRDLGGAMPSVDAVSAVVSGFEKDKKGLPVLLRHYLKLNGVLLSFNVDTEFSDVIDGLILVDLFKTERKLMKRYMGEEGARRFFEYHGETTAV
jgi:putative hemolysin